MDLIARYVKSIEQMKSARDYIKQLNPVDYSLTAVANDLDLKINQAEEKLNTLRGKHAVHRCEFCDRPFDEEPVVSIGGLKICPVCRSRGPQYQLGSVLEEKYDLPQGTIKRDCRPGEDGKAKLQAYMDVGLVFKSGSRPIVHQKVIELYYMDEINYKRRSSRGE
ncbi:hypothetical protein ACFQZE_23650 [Paenibacillus sp. GCM10027627]|uniref:hypothetical protein n=1 Tax=unclassified Paenibacillus TaxID=185978 RepID=UPI003633C713